MDEPIAGKNLLTTDEGKMYNIYVLQSNGDYSPLEDDTLWDCWYDHCIDPEAFMELAKKHGCEYTKTTYDFVCEQYRENYLR